MKRTLIFIAAVLMALPCPAARTLNNWIMQKEGSKDTYNVTVPCTVAGALNEAGVFGKDVLDRDRYFGIDKEQFDSPWIFITKFNAEPGMKHILRFNGLGYRAEISLNGNIIASADTTFGLFIVREFDITKIAKKNNVLKVKVRRAQPGDLNTGYVDWNPRPVDESMGILREVELVSTPDVQVADVFVKPEVNPADLTRAEISITATLVNRSDAPVQGVFSGSYEGGSFGEDVSLGPRQTRIVTVRRTIEKPHIWWTREMGRPELYNLVARFENGGKVSDVKKVRFGIRSITSEITDKGHRQFYLNGKPVLIKSAGWTDDIFMQDTPQSIRNQMAFVRDMGLNCVRFENIWGKDDLVYDLCDEMGILALVGWSCQWEWENYCGLPETGHYGCINDPASEDLAVRYFHDQIIRLRNHPAVIGWLTGSDRIPNPRLEERYMALYNELDYRPYVCSAKGMTSKFGGPSGTKMEGPYEYVGPDYWYIDTKYGGAYGFNTETGVGLNIPQSESVRRMVGEDHLWPADRNWDVHCTASSTDMNSTKTATEVMTGLYGAPSGFEDFMRKAHSLDYDSTRSMYEAFRCNVPTATGIVQWMLNSAWPSMYWQLYDWYMVPTAGYFGTKKACAPVQLIFNYGDRCVWAVDDAMPLAEYTATIHIYGPDSKLIKEESKKVRIAPREPQKVFDEIEGACFVALELKNEKDRIVADNFYCVPATQNKYNWKKTNWYISPITEYSDLSFVSALPETSVSMKSVAVPGGFDVTLTNDSQVVAYQNILKAKDASGQLIPSVLWSDNFVSLAPGQTKKVHCIIPEGSGPASLSLEGWNATVNMAAPDSLDRNRSKYATYNFTKDDEYTGTDPYVPEEFKQPKGKKIKNVIFMIGDGMGFEQVSCAWVVNGGALYMDRMSYLGASRTYAVDRLVTDSCAGGNALSTGVKTKYGYIGMDPDANPIQSVLMKAKSLGKKTGVTVTCRINDATPADFVAHSTSRKEEEYVASQFVGSGVDFISGGGTHFWNQRSDGRNLIEEMKAQGYTYVDKVEDIAGAQGDKFLGLYDEYDLKGVNERGPVLLESTRKALQMLDNKKGFFLMIEGSQIDDWGHRKKVGMVCEELLEFDRVLGEVLKFAEKDGHTLVVVTADHATGGLTLLKGSLEERNVKVNFSTSGHNGIVVPVFAYGPGAEAFAGVHENGEVGQIISRLLK